MEQVTRVMTKKKKTNKLLGVNRWDAEKVFN